MNKEGIEISYDEKRTVRIVFNYILAGIQLDPKNHQRSPNEIASIQQYNRPSIFEYSQAITP